LSEAATPAAQPEQQMKPKPRTVYKCDFRSSGRLSNEDSRSLNVIHEGFAQYVSSALDAYLGTSCEVKMETLDQPSIKDHVESLPAHCHIVPVSSNSVFLEFDNELAFPIIELLLGGSGDTTDQGRELSEIEEEIMQDIVLLICRQAASAWRMPSLALSAGSRIKATEMYQAFGVNEKAIVLRFGVQLGSVESSFRLVFPAEFANAILKQTKLEEPRGKSHVWNFPRPPLRERILDCEFEMIAELAGLRVPVRDLIALQPGSVLKLHAPIRNPGTLTSGGHSLFEVLPVRVGAQRAAQLGRWIRPTDRKGK
jgi:flagellar motor switch protein FliM